MKVRIIEHFVQSLGFEQGGRSAGPPNRFDLGPVSGGVLSPESSLSRQVRQIGTFSDHDCQKRHAALGVIISSAAPIFRRCSSRSWSICSPRKKPALSPQ